MKIKEFVKSLKAEARKISWPRAKETAANTGTVLGIGIVLGAALSVLGRLSDIGVNAILSLF